MVDVTRGGDDGLKGRDWRYYSALTLQSHADCDALVVAARLACRPIGGRHVTVASRHTHELLVQLLFHHTPEEALKTTGNINYNLA